MGSAAEGIGAVTFRELQPCNPEEVRLRDSEASKNNADLGRMCPLARLSLRWCLRGRGLGRFQDIPKGAFNLAHRVPDEMARAPQRLG